MYKQKKKKLNTQARQKWRFHIKGQDYSLILSINVYPIKEKKLLNQFRELFHQLRALEKHLFSKGGIAEGIPNIHANS